MKLVEISKAGKVKRRLNLIGTYSLRPDAIHAAHYYVVHGHVAMMLEDRDGKYRVFVRLK